MATDYDASRFSSLPGRVFNARERRLIVRAFGDTLAGGTIADIPCGTGRLAEPLLAVIALAAVVIAGGYALIAWLR